jgi:hypothetical protein
MTKTPLPYWPAAMGLELAASYCGLCVDTFKEVCPVKPIPFTSSSRGNRYLRARLDQWLETIDPNKEAPTRRFGDRILEAFANRPIPPKRRRRRGVDKFSQRSD